MVEGGLHERSSRSRRALRNTPRSSGRVSLPVNVFCWLGWYEAISATPSAKVATAPCAKRGARRGRCEPDEEEARLRVAEARQRPRPVGEARIPARRRRRDGFAMGDEPGAGATSHDHAREPLESALQFGRIVTR